MPERKPFKHFELERTFLIVSVGEAGGKGHSKALAAGSVSSYGKAGLPDPFIRCMVAAMHDNPVCFNSPTPLKPGP